MDIAALFARVATLENNREQFNQHHKDDHESFEEIRDHYEELLAATHRLDRLVKTNTHQIAAQGDALALHEKQINWSENLSAPAQKHNENQGCGDWLKRCPMPYGDGTYKLHQMQTPKVAIGAVAFCPWCGASATK